jgi:YfiH family protein
MRRDGFVPRENQGVPFLSCTAFEKLEGFRHAFSTRHGGVPGAGVSSLNLGYSEWDSPERVTRNRKRFLSALSLDETPLATLHQVHSNRVHIIGDLAGEWNQPEGDALITGLQGITLAVQTADCLPVLIADPVKNVIAAVHSGWRGTLSRVLSETVRKMQSAFDTHPADLLVAVGPGIQACCFQVGPEVAQPFYEQYDGGSLIMPMHGVADKYLLDMERALEIQCIEAGIDTENCYSSGACTRCNPDEFFSFRAEGALTGRMMAVICRSAYQT